MRSFAVVLAVACSLVAAACTVGPSTEGGETVGTHRVRASPEAARELVARGGAVIADYGGFQLLELPSGVLPSALEQPGVELRDDSVRILLNSGDLDTTSPAAAALAAELPADRVAPSLHLVQLAGPIRAEWHEALAASGLRIVSYVPHDAYLVYGPAANLDAFSEEIDPRVLQFRAAYTAPLKIDRALSGHDPGAYAVQLVEDPMVNGETLALVRSLATVEPRVDHALGYVNVVLRTDRAGAEALAARPDVVSVLEWSEPQLNDERQDMVLAGAISNGVPTGPGYLAWLTAKGFTQEQFDASGFGVDVSDSGLDNATDQPEHPGLYRHGNPTAGSRVVYARLEGTPHSGGTLQGCDGHGTLNAHVVGGYVGSSSAPFTDPQGFRYGLGVAPFVRLGSSVVFDPSYFTAPDYEDLQSRAYAAGMRISSNSWGASTSAYTSDAQRYDALVRDAQPTGSAVPAAGNQQMVIVFAAGNDGPYTGSVGSPATAKNVIAVGAAEGVQAFNGADGCGVGDSGANSAMDVIYFSSRGPTADGRIRPDLMAPGTHISGGVAQAPGQRGPPPAFPLGKALSCFAATGVCGGVSNNRFFPAGQEWYTASSGTSHSTPAVAGAAALLRQWSLNQGLPPPSPAMTKAYLANSTRHMTGEGANDSLLSRNQGMGMVDLGAAFDGTARLLRDQEAEDLFTASGQTRTFTGNIGDATRPFRVTLAWTDAPGATFGAAWVNDLDLTVEVNGLLYRGNVFSGATSITGGAATPRDNLESVFLPAGVTGPFTVRVTAATIAGDGVPGNATALDQDFALVVWNECAETPPASPQGVSAAPAGDNAISISWNAVPGATGYQVHRGPSAAGPWTFAGSPAAPPFVDAGRSGGTTYHYQVRARRDCAASAPAVASATATGACLLPPAFGGLQSAASTGGITCADFLTWTAATPSCGGAVTYDVFRGVPGFTPGPSNRIATGIAGTTFTDQGDLVSGTLYGYVVRAVETSTGGSASDENTVIRAARPYFAGGRFEDDFDDVRPPSPVEWWSERIVSGTDGLGIVEGCHYQSSAAAYRFGSSATTCGGSYANSVQNRLVMGGDAASGFVIPGNGSTLEFRLWYDFESYYDGAVLQYSTAGPDGPWTTIPSSSTAGSPFIQTGGYDGTSYSLGSAWTGRQAPADGALRPVVVNLDALEGRTAWFAWLFHTDSVITREGLFLDDVVLNGTGGTCSTTPVPPGTPYRFRLTGLPSTARADDLLTVTILAVDENNQTATSYAGTAALTSDDPQAVLPGTVTFTAGVATPQVRFRTVGRRYVTAVDTSISALRGTGTTQITAGPAAALAFQVQPLNTTAGWMLYPAPSVSVRDAFGNATTEASPVSLALAPNDASAVLNGTTSTSAVSGVASFTAVYVERAGTGYRLVATSPGLTSAESEPFSVAAGMVQRIAISSQPTAVRAGDFFSPPLAVQLQDRYGNPTQASGSISLSIANGPLDGHVLGQTTLWATDGIANFGGAWLDKVGTYRILASGTGLGTATSELIDVKPGDPHHARFSAAPSMGQAAVPFGMPFTATLLDPYGNQCTSASSPDLTLYFAGGSAHAALLGATTVRPVNGVATFGQVGFDRPGEFTVYVGSPGIEGDFTSTIVVEPGPVTGYRLSGPSSVAAGESITIQAEALDAYERFEPYLGTAWILTSDPAGEVPDDEVTFSNGTSGPLAVVLRTTGTQRIVMRDAAGNGVEGSLTLEVTDGEPPPEPGGGGCGSGGAAGAGSLLAAGLWLAMLRRRRGS